jgi:hypothetical protein
MTSKMGLALLKLRYHLDDNNNPDLTRPRLTVPQMAQLLDLTPRQLYYRLGKAEEGHIFELKPVRPKKAHN